MDEQKLWSTDRYATHQPLLVWAVHNTVGPVLELGIGAHSTPILHMLCENRILVSADTNKDYYDAFSKLANPWHQLVHISDWEKFNALDQIWDVIFVDHAPAEARRPVLERIRGKATYVVVHDTELQAYYGYDKIFPLYNYRVDCKWQSKWSTVLSMLDPMYGLQLLLDSSLNPGQLFGDSYASDDMCIRSDEE